MVRQLRFLVGGWITVVALLVNSQVGRAALLAGRGLCCWVADGCAAGWYDDCGEVDDCCCAASWEKERTARWERVDEGCCAARWDRTALLGWRAVRWERSYWVVRQLHCWVTGMQSDDGCTAGLCCYGLLVGRRVGEVDDGCRERWTARWKKAKGSTRQRSLRPHDRCAAGRER